MREHHLLQFSHNPWANGLRLALLNFALACFCIVSWLGTLFAAVLLSQWNLAAGGAPSASVPFPYPLLLLFYVLMFLFTWVWCGRRLPGPRRALFQTALIGSVPFFGLGLLGYAGVAGLLILGDFNAENMLAAGVFVYSVIATLCLFAGLTCVGMILWLGGNGRGETIDAR